MTPTRTMSRSLAYACARALALAGCLAGALAAPATVAAAATSEAPGVERNVKAAFLYKFLSYVEYPQALLDNNAPYVVGVAGTDDIAAELSRITAGRNINNHPVQVRVVRAGDTLAGVHLLFIGAAEAARGSPALLRAAQQAGVLSVTETPGALQAGSVINFRLVDDRVRFEVSLEAAEKSNLRLSSRLLSVAYTVQKGGS